MGRFQGSRLSSDLQHCTTSRITHLDAGKATQPSPNEVRFDEAVKALLAENHTPRLEVAATPAGDDIHPRPIGTSLHLEAKNS